MHTLISGLAFSLIAVCGNIDPLGYEGGKNYRGWTKRPQTYGSTSLMAFGPSWQLVLCLLHGVDSSSTAFGTGC
jgi:hypothetical protein